MSKWSVLLVAVAFLVLGLVFYSNLTATATQNQTSNLTNMLDCDCGHCAITTAMPCECSDSDVCDCPHSKSAAISTNMETQEHPGEHPGKRTQKSDEPDIKKTVEDAVTHYTKWDSKVKGTFLVFDPKENDVWMFKDVIKYHPIRQIDDTHYFLCSDWNGSRIKDSATHKVDLDFFLSKKGRGMGIDRVVVHKVDGVEYPRGAYCPMHPDVKMFCTKCGPCPVCGSELKESK